MHAFATYLAQNGITFETSEEFNMRMTLFAVAEARIQAHNSANVESSYTIGHNKFSIMSAEEKSTMLNLNVSAMQLGTVENGATVTLDVSNLSKSVNWVDEGAVTTPKDQGSCGSCWTFASTGMLEGAYKIAGNDLQSFSEQQLLDCAGEDVYASGCDGGSIASGLWFWETNKALKNTTMPYEGVAQTCTQSNYASEATNVEVINWQSVVQYSGD